MEPVVVVVSGPESSGKSRLCQELSTNLNCPWVPEYAREYLEKHGPNYDRQDFLTIYKGHKEKQNEALLQKPSLLIFDTDSINFSVWGQWVFEEEFDIIKKGRANEHKHHYLLCRPDLPWEQDPLRCNPKEREAIFEAHRAWMEKLNRPYRIVEGEKEERLTNALNALQEMNLIKA